MAAATNTKRITSHICRTTIHSWLLAGAAAAGGLNLYTLVSPESDQSERIGMAVIGLFILLMAILLGVIVGMLRKDRMRKRIASQEGEAAVPFDAENLQPVTAEKNLLLGKDWMVINTGPAAIPLTRASIASADSINTRKAGMQKLWARITDKTGKSYACLYKAAENDGLAAVQNWLGSAEKPAERSVPEPQPGGTCPFCTGPNEPGSKVCQWCGKDLNEAVPVRAAFTEPSQGKLVIQPVQAPRSIPEEGKKNSKTVYIVIGVLAVILAVLLYIMFA